MFPRRLVAGSERISHPARRTYAYASPTNLKRYIHSRDLSYGRRALGNDEKGGEVIMQHNAITLAGKPAARWSKPGSRSYGGYLYTQDSAKNPGRDTNLASDGNGQDAGIKPQHQRSLGADLVALCYCAAYLILICIHLEQVPISGRWRIVAIHLDGLTEIGKPRSSGQQGYLRRQEEALNLEETRLQEYDPVVNRVKHVLDRLLEASGLSHFQWQLEVCDRPSLWRVLDAAGVEVDYMGNVVVFERIFEAVHTDDELAVVLSHGLAHCVAREVAEKVCEQTLYTTVMLSSIPYAIYMALARKWLLYPIPLFALGIQIIWGQYRKPESEADYISMLLVSEAGFDPRAAGVTWRKLESLGSEELETHGSEHLPSAFRINEMETLVPEVLYLTDRAPAPVMNSSTGATALQEKKRLWQKFLRNRQTTTNT